MSSLSTRRRSLRPALALASAGLLVACTGGPSTEGDPDGPAPTGTPAAEASGELALLPPVAQPGAEPAPADAAQVVAIADFGADDGSQVVLERREGEDWVEVDSAAYEPGGTRLLAASDEAGEGLRAVLTDGEDDVAVTGTVEPAWEQRFSSEFEGRRLDPERWAPRAVGVYNPEGSRTCSASSPAAVQVAGGTLRLSAFVDPDRRQRTCRTQDHGDLPWMVNGHVSTAGNFAATHGVAAARLLFPRNRGQHGALWLQPAVRGDDPTDTRAHGAEIDVAEYFGDDGPEAGDGGGGGMASYVHHRDRDGNPVKLGELLTGDRRWTGPDGEEYWQGYHVFSVQWSPEGYVFRIDGDEVFRTDEGVSGVDQYLILSLLTSDYEIGYARDRQQRATMHVDWVRYWQQ